MQRLKGKVALVAGATRGAGRGIACMLGEAGATVYNSWGLAREYGFTDLDGSQPDLGRHFDFEQQFKTSSRTEFRWTITRPVGAPGEGRR